MSEPNYSTLDVAREIENAVVRAFSVDLERVEAVLDQAQAACLLKVPSDDARLEVRRRIAEWKMRLFCDRDAPIKDASRLRDALQRLGHTDLEVESNNELYFALYCLRVREPSIARTIVQGLYGRLNDRLMKNPLQVFEVLRDDASKILASADEMDSARSDEK